jgi:hypothetical protein
MHTDALSLALALLAGIAISAACGLRAFLPLLALGLGARFFGLELQPALHWLTGDLALLALGIATVLEIAGDKLPAVDHALDVVATFIRPVTAAIATYGLLVHWPAPWAQILAVLLGGSALALHVAKAKTRVGSSLLSFGLVNPLLSVVEDGMSVVLVLVAFLAPLLIAFVLLLVFLFLTRHRASAPPAEAARR